MNGEISMRLIDPSDLDRTIQRLADAAGTTAREVLPAQMRLLAVDLAFNTRPIGKSASVQKEHQMKILGKIMFSYTSVGTAYKIIKEADPKQAAKFRRSVKAGNFAEATAVMNANTKSPVRYHVGKFDGGAMHQKYRFRKKVQECLVCTDFQKAVVYAKEVIKRSGYAKGGFAAAAKQLGGTRGIPGFATRQPSPGSGSVTGDGKTLSVTMINGVKYIEQALDRHGEERALMNRKRSADLVIKRMMDRKLKSASRSIK